MRNRFLDKLGKEWLLFDGGMGSLLQKRGLKTGELPETWNLTHREDIIDIHRSYLEAGSDVIYTNTFGANRFKYPDSLSEIVSGAVSCAAEARKRAGREDDAFVALDIGPCGRLLQPMGDLAFEDAVSLFSEIVAAGTKAGADLIVIETMNDSLETKAAVLAAKENSDLPVVATCVFDEKGKMLTGGTPEVITAMLEGLRVDALGANCSLGPDKMVSVARRFLACSSLPVVIKPNAGIPRVENGETVYDVGPEEFASVMAEIADLGIHAMGGCCGTDPSYIRELKKMLYGTKEGAAPAGHPAPLKAFIPPVPKDLSLVSSFADAVRIGEKTVIIGERINPTGKKRFKEALKSHDMDYILSQGLQQEDAGADILDVNVGLPGIDETAMMKELVPLLQSVTALPLQLDTADPKALEAGMRIYNGKPMVNSVNGRDDVMDAVFPLVRKYGGVVVGLLLDENGIPETAEGRFRIAQKIYQKAASFGIQPKDIVIDCLTMTVSANSRSALTTLECMRKIRHELGGRTILGVSNVSFGLPQRENINAAFLIMAIREGLDCAIINPNSEAMMSAFRSALALTEQDPDFNAYITAYAEEPGSSQSAPKQDAPEASNAGPGAYIERGMETKAAEAALQMLQHADALTIINEELVPAMDRVGAQFEKGTLFLPQLLRSAEAAKKTFEAIKAAMPGSDQAMKGRMILATVEGDIHDIGKNIVRILCENYGYEVLDLGKNVPAETIVETALKEDIKLVGLSALMTTTVTHMEETIRLLREKKPDTKIVVGGAVLTPEYARLIGADHYARDAMSTVRYADEVFG
ncbi:MAG: homocysteine S-methyltransferase family protein [Lachnospiraceae bacterium]|nr:homocysteine S-methyltransferase family protein [Lachnospiraceae bacterium]